MVDTTPNQPPVGPVAKRQAEYQIQASTEIMPDEMIDELALKHSESSSAKLYSCLLQDLNYSRKKYKTLCIKKGIHKTRKKRSLLADVNTLS